MTADAVRKAIQSTLGVLPDGVIGPKTMASLEQLRLANPDSEWPPAAHIHVCKASSFADPADVEAFKRCKATGKTDQQCFAVGDNGIGQFGKVTAQNLEPMCALHADDMIAEFGSVEASAHQLVKVTVNGRSAMCAVEDRLGVKGRIDLNPAAALVLGLHPPFLVTAQWQRA